MIAKVVWYSDFLCVSDGLSPLAVSIIDVVEDEN